LQVEIEEDKIFTPHECTGTNFQRPNHVEQFNEFLLSKELLISARIITS